MVYDEEFDGEAGSVRIFCNKFHIAEMCATHSMLILCHHRYYINKFK